MLKFLGWMIKVSLALALVLFGAHFLKWDGITISDQIRTHLSHAETPDLVGTAKHWVKRSTASVTKKTRQISTSAPDSEQKDSERDEISATERQRLRNLIQDLNTSHR